MDARLVTLKETAACNRTFLEGHVSSVDGITSDAKRKWHAFSAQAENDTKDNADYSAAKHCRMELILQQWYIFFLTMLKLNHCVVFSMLTFIVVRSVNATESTLNHWRSTHEAVNGMGRDHLSSISSLVRLVLQINIMAYKWRDKRTHFLSALEFPLLYSIMMGFLLNNHKLIVNAYAGMLLTAMSNMIWRSVLQGMQLSKMWPGVVMMWCNMLIVSGTFQKLEV